LADLKSLEKRNTVLKSILNSSWDGIAVISLDGKFVYINKAFSPLFAYSQEVILKFNFLDLLDYESKKDFKQLLKDNLVQTHNHKLTLAGIRNGGKQIYITVSIQLMSNEKMYILNISDITEIVTKSNQIDRFVITIEFNTQLLLTNASEAFYKISSFSKDDILNKDFTNLLAPSTIPFHRSALKNSFKDKLNWEGKLVINQKNGSSFNVEAVCNPILNKYSDVIAYSLIMTNISNFKSTKEEDFKRLLIEEEEKLSIMSDTMRTVAHEWRQPLNIISLGAQELIFELDFDDSIDKKSIKEQLEIISKNTQNLSSVIKSFQNITNIDSSKKKRNIKEIVNEALKIANLTQDFVKIEHKDTKAFRTYPKELALSLSSIMINAKEALDKKEDKQINIITYDDGANIICEISNNGGHIPNKFIKQIFTPYFSTKEETNGVGLSLYACKMLVELHLKGKIKVLNKRDNIVNFKLSLPKSALD
jgi:PAS domain S-box-containing protein